MFPSVMDRQLTGRHTHLYTEFMNGITLDAGVLFPLSSLINIGGVVRNIGYENTNNYMKIFINFFLF